MANTISAAELADFMGISLRTLKKLDESGELPALRHENGRRYYTSSHIPKALAIMGGSDVKNIEIAFRKNGVSSMCGRANIPARWLNGLGISPESPDCFISYDGEKIIITKSRPE